MAPTPTIQPHERRYRPKNGQILEEKIIEVGVESKLVDYVFVFYFTTFLQFLSAPIVIASGLRMWLLMFPCAREIESQPVRWSAILAGVRMNGLFCVLNLFFDFQKIKADFDE